MSDFLSSLIRREQGLPAATGVGPRLPALFEDAPREQVIEVQESAVIAAAREPEGAAEPASRTAPAPVSARPRVPDAPIATPTPSGPPPVGLEPPAARMTAAPEPSRPRAPEPYPSEADASLRREARHAPSPAATRSDSDRAEPHLVVVEHVTPRPPTAPAATSPSPTPVDETRRVVPDEVSPRLEAVPEREPVVEPEPAPVIRVTIGRVEVRAVPAAPVAAPRRAAQTDRENSPMSLDEYLQQRDAGRGR